jgi:hypothetical protein
VPENKKKPKRTTRGVKLGNLSESALAKNAVSGPQNVPKKRNKKAAAEAEEKSKR